MLHLSVNALKSFLLTLIQLKVFKIHELKQDRTLNFLAKRDIKRMSKATCLTAMWTLVTEALLLQFYTTHIVVNNLWGKNTFGRNLWNMINLILIGCHNKTIVILYRKNVLCSSLKKTTILWSIENKHLASLYIFTENNNKSSNSPDLLNFKNIQNSHICDKELWEHK